MADTNERRCEATALVDEAVSLGALGRDAEAIAVYDDMVRRFGTAGEPTLRQQVAMALVNKGDTLDDLGRVAEASAVFDEVFARFGAADEPALKEVVERAQSLMDALAKPEGRTKQRVTWWPFRRR